MKRIFAGVNAVLAVSAGIIVLLGYFIESMAGFRFFLLQWAVILAGVAVLIGIGNLFSVHLQKIHERRPGSVYSLVLLFFMLLTAVVGFSPDLKPIQTMFLDGIMVPVEISLIAVLAITLIYSGIRILRVRGDWVSILFLATALIILLGIGPLPYLGAFPIIGDWLRPFISYALATGGARGILIGVALGTLTTGIRILIGIDRPYGGK
jgi:hypothetical protein